MYVQPALYEQPTWLLGLFLWWIYCNAHALRCSSLCLLYCLVLAVVCPCTPIYGICHFLNVLLCALLSMHNCTKGSTGNMHQNVECCWWKQFSAKARWYRVCQTLQQRLQLESFPVFLLSGSIPVQCVDIVFSNQCTPLMSLTCKCVLNWEMDNSC